MNRRDLFKSFLQPLKEEKETSSAIRPPYFSDKRDFLNICVLCEQSECVDACEEEIIELDKDRTPIINFSKGGCTYCDECAVACQKDVLKVENRKNIDVQIEIDILECLSWHKVMCFSCKDPCFENAIDFQGMFRPTINDRCTSCGFCLSVCPSNAIKVKNRVET